MEHVEQVENADGDLGELIVNVFGNDDLAIRHELSVHERHTLWRASVLLSRSLSTGVNAGATVVLALVERLAKTRNGSLTPLAALRSFRSLWLPDAAPAFPFPASVSSGGWNARLQGRSGQWWPLAMGERPMCRWVVPRQLLRGRRSLPGRR
jgi:hypothetical protein